MRAARAMLRIDQRELAELSGLSLPTIQRMEASDGVVRGNVDSLMKLVGALQAAGIELIAEGAASARGGRGVRLIAPDPAARPGGRTRMIALTLACIVLLLGLAIAGAFVAAPSGARHRLRRLSRHFAGCRC